MELKQLRYLSAIARWGSFTAAAEALFIAQPALSIQIAKLEQEVGHPLFDRGRHGARLTPFGSLFLQKAESILEDVRALKAMGEASPPKVVVRLGVTPLISAVLTVPLLAEIRNEHPSIALVVQESMSAVLSDQLNRGEIDIAILNNASRAGFPDALTLMSEPLILCTSDQLQLSSSNSFPVTSLGSIPLVTSSRGNASRQLLEEIAVDAGLSLNVVAEVSSINGQKELVSQGVGAALYPPIGPAVWGPNHGFKLWKLTGTNRAWNTTMAISKRACSSEALLTIQTLITRLTPVLRAKSAEESSGR